MKKIINTMKCIGNKFMEMLKNKDYTTREAILAMIVLFLSGVIIGSICSPKKNLSICSNNGCNNGNGNNSMCLPNKENEEEETA